MTFLVMIIFCKTGGAAAGREALNSKRREGGERERDCESESESERESVIVVDLL